MLASSARSHVSRASRLRCPAAAVVPRLTVTCRAESTTATATSETTPAAAAAPPATQYPSFRHALSPTPLAAFHAEFDARFAAKERDPSTKRAVAGRIVSRRDASGKLVFLTLQSLDARAQVMVSRSNVADAAEWDRIKHAMHVGDLAYFAGFPGKTGTGELSLIAESGSVLAPAKHEIPFKAGIKDADKRARNRVVDLLVNRGLQQRLLVRARVMRRIRDFFDARGFVEVDTPVLSTLAGGANARPFVTTANAYDMSMSLRVAPELYLKKLVVAGFERVYELGKQFRNEGFDATHNPEFVTCEFYQAYATLDDLLVTTQDLLRELAVMVHGESGARAVPVSMDGHTTHEIDFTKPFRVIDVVPFLAAKLGEPLPADLEALDAADQLVAIFKRHRVQLPHAPHTVPRLIDALISELIEPECVQPTFVRGHPRVMSPLAKSVPENPAIAARVELFIAGKEVVNAYEELNDPDEQRARFAQQQKDKDSGDVEAQPLDEDYCRALEYGLPPTAGWGLGVDRLIMMLTGVHHIREVMPFPTVRPQQHHAKARAEAEAAE
ncbi:hypothetical protein H9P43_000173 [Blastocladiella emersonii ATCC 22665]|nr:hypothetical protein H9P43_000173 [Blastocladiella emersonii ATCC 22665]